MTWLFQDQSWNLNYHYALIKISNIFFIFKQPWLGSCSDPCMVSQSRLKAFDQVSIMTTNICEDLQWRQTHMTTSNTEAWWSSCTGCSIAVTLSLSHTIQNSNLDWTWYLNTVALLLYQFWTLEIDTCPYQNIDLNCDRSAIKWFYQLLQNYKSSMNKIIQI